MGSKAAITVRCAQDEAQRLWEDPAYRPDYIAETGAATTFKEAPGDRGTEIHVDLDRQSPRGGIGRLLHKLRRPGSLAKVKDELRRFKQLVETGEIARSEGTPEGERAERKLKQRPAQPLERSERERVGV